MSITNAHIESPLGHGAGVRRRAIGALDVDYYHLRARYLRSHVLRLWLAKAAAFAARCVQRALRSRERTSRHTAIDAQATGASR